MKKSFFVLSFMATTTLTANTWAAKTCNCGTNCCWEIQNGVLTVSVDDSQGATSGSVAGYSPVSGAPWYNQRNSVTSVVIEGKKTDSQGNPIAETGITSVGGAGGALYDFQNVTSITIPDSVTHIGGSAFSGAKKVTTLIIPDSVTSIGGYAFHNLTGLKTLVIPDSVTTMNASAFGRWHSETQSAGVGDSITDLTISATNLQKYLEANGGFASNANITCTSGDCTTTLTQWDTAHGTHYSSNVTVTIPPAATTQQGGSAGGNGGNSTGSGKRIYTVEEARAAVEAAGTDTVNFRIRYK